MGPVTHRQIHATDGERDLDAEPGKASRVRLEPGPGKESTTQRLELEDDWVGR